MTSGNFVVGIVAFVIITLVQFMVVTKGSERVAEVAARFTLDALPGKQMSIDADLNAGLIDAEQAKQGVKNYRKNLTSLDLWMVQTNLLKVMRLQVLLLF